MKKTVRFYSEEELAQVKELAMTGLPVKGLIEDFCTINNRPFHSVALKIYEMRAKLNIPKKSKTGKDEKVVKTPKVPKTSKAVKAELAPTVKDKSVVNIGKGEFNIPIKSWNITQHTDGFYFNVKF